MIRLPYYGAALLGGALLVVAPPPPTGGGGSAFPTGAYGSAYYGGGYEGANGVPHGGVVTPPTDTTPPTVPTNVTAVATADGAVVTWDPSIDPGDDTEPPTTPTGLHTTSVGQTSVILAWSASTDNIGVVGYKLYRGGSLVQTLGNVTAAIDSGLTASTSYNYQVSAYDLDGNESVLTAVLAVTTLASGGGTIVTPSAYGPSTPAAGGSTIGATTYVVKADGLIYDVTGTTVQNLLSKTFTGLILIKSDVAGTRRAQLPNQLAGSIFQAGLTFREVLPYDDALNIDVNGATLRLEGVGRPASVPGSLVGRPPRFKHQRAVNAAVNPIELAAATSGPCGSTASQWDTTNPDLIIENVTTHGPSATGAGIAISGANAAHNVYIGGWDPGSQSSPAGIPGPMLFCDGATLDDVQDVRVGPASDGTPTVMVAKTGSFATCDIRHCRRCGFDAGEEGGVIVVNTSGSRPSRPYWLGSTDGAVPGGETSANTSNAKTIADVPIARRLLAQFPVNYVFRDGSTHLMTFEVDHTVWDPAVAAWGLGEKRLVNPVFGIGVMPTGTPLALTNKQTLDASFTIPGGSAGTFRRAADGWLELSDAIIDCGTPGAQFLADGSGSGGVTFKVDNSKGAQLAVAPSGSGYTNPVIPAWDGVGAGGVRLRVTAPGGGTPDLSKWDIGPPPTGNPGDQGIYTNFSDAALSTIVDPALGIGYRRALIYRSIDTSTGEFVGVYLVPTPSGGNITAPAGDVLRSIAGTPGKVEHVNPHGMATGEQCTYTGVPGLADGTYQVTKVDINTVSLKTIAGVNVTILSGGLGNGTAKYDPLGPGGTGYSYGLSHPTTGAALGAATLALPPGTTLDSYQNTNYGQPYNNAQLNLGSDAVGLRFNRVITKDTSLNAVDLNGRFWLADSPMQVAPLYGGGREYDQVNEGVRGTYNSSNQHEPARALTSLNVIAPGEAMWIFERSPMTNVHGDAAPGKFGAGSVQRHCYWHHGRDSRNPSSGSSNTQAGIGTNLYSADAGVHGDIYQPYNRFYLRVEACIFHTHGHAIWFSRIWVNYGNSDYTTCGTGNQTFTCDATGTITFTPGANHGNNVFDRIYIDGTGDARFDGHEFPVTAQTSTKVTMTGGPLAAATVVGRAQRVVHLNCDFRRCDFRTTKHWDTTDVFDLTSVRSQGNVSVVQTESYLLDLNQDKKHPKPVDPGRMTLVAKLYDNRWGDNYGPPVGSGALWSFRNPASPVVGVVYDIGASNGNRWTTFGDIANLTGLGSLATPNIIG